MKSVLSVREFFLMCAVGIVVLVGIRICVCESGMDLDLLVGVVITGCIADLVINSLKLYVRISVSLSLAASGSKRSER
jgi:hypothetical protein